MNRMLLTAFAVPLALCVGGCGDRETSRPTTAPTAEVNASPPTNRIDVPAAVRQNLGITFAKVERRRVASTVRVPGRFELLPTARHEYRATVPGFVKLMVDRYDPVKKGTPLYELDSHEWHRVRQGLHDQQAKIETATAELAVARQAKVEAERAAERTRKRIEELAGAEVRRAELETTLAAAVESLPRLQAEIGAKEVELREAKQAFPIAIAAAASLVGLAEDTLTEQIDTPSGRVARWRSLSSVGAKAAADGVVEGLHVNTGSWVEQNALVLSTIDPNRLGFRAVGLQSDLAKLKDGQDVLIVPPQAGAATTAPVPILGKLKVGLNADPEQRTIDLLVTPDNLAPWARPGVSTFLEIYTNDSGKGELAVPVRAVIRDELTSVFFRRDPKDPDKVIRMEADLGVSDGKWVVVQSGLGEDDEVVLDGVYELKLAGGGKPAGGSGHFHADGTYHDAHGPEKE